MNQYRIWTEEEKEIVRVHYTGNRVNVMWIAQKTGHPVKSVRGQAYKLGLGQRIDSKRWTEKEEEKLAELLTQYHMTEVARIMKRSVNSCVVKAHIMKLSRRTRDGYFTQKEAAQLLGVDSHWVQNRIANGEIVASPNNGSIPTNGGSYWRITEVELKRFIIEHQLQITGRNIDIALFVYIFTGEG